MARRQKGEAREIVRLQEEEARKAMRLRDEARAQIRDERKRELDARLLAEHLPCIGYYYRSCINNSTEPIDDRMMAEFRFRNSLWNRPLYDNLVKELIRDFGRPYSGVHAHARDMVRRRYVVDERGTIGPRRKAGDHFVLENPEYAGSSDDDDDD